MGSGNSLLWCWTKSGDLTLGVKTNRPFFKLVMCVMQFCLLFVSLRQHLGVEHESPCCELREKTGCECGRAEYGRMRVGRQQQTRKEEEK